MVSLSSWPATRTLNVALLLVTLAVVLWVHLSPIPSANAVIEDNLNLKVVMHDGVTALPNAIVTVTNSSIDYVQPVACSAYGCWANYTSIIEGNIVNAKVKWENSWVNGTVSITVDSTKDVTLVCEVYPFSLAWFDHSWVALVPTITSYRVTVSNGTNTGTLLPGVSYLFQNGTSSYFAVMWEGTDVTSTTPTFRPESGCSACTLCKVYEIAPTFTTFLGTVLPVQVTSYKMWASNGTLSGILNPSLVYDEQWGIAAGDQVIWEGSNVTPATGLSFLPSAGSPIFKLNVFAITPSWRYSDGTPLPTPPTSYKWTPANGTLSSALTAGTAYWLQNGTTTVSAVIWGGSNVTPSSGATFDAIDGNPIIRLNIAPPVGGTTIPVTTVPTGTTTVGLQFAAQVVPNYWFTPSATVRANITVTNAAQSGRTTTVTYTVTRMGSSETVYQDTTIISVPSSSQVISFTVPVSNFGTYQFLIKATSSAGGTTQISPSVTVSFMDVWQGPIVIWGSVAVVATAVVLAIMGREQIMSVIEQLYP